MGGTPMEEGKPEGGGAAEVPETAAKVATPVSSLQVDKRDDGIIVVTINRPERMNALDRPTLAAGRELIRDILYDRTVRVLIVTGAGGKAFCAGADLKEREGMTMDQVRQYIAYIRDTFTEIENLPIPVIAAINGFALGGGLELALACDIRVAARSARMALNETSLGIIPGGGGTQRLSRLVGRGVAKELVLTARWVGAQEAVDIGLVNHVVDDDKLMVKALEVATQIIANGPVAITQAKFVINRGVELPLQEALRLESEAYEVCIPTKDRLEALAAFKEKRKPQFRGE
jgi:methylglutaconyl-CoA hydratase